MDHSKLVDHLATIIRLDLSRSRWFALASVEMAAILVVSTPPQNQPGHHAPGFFVSTLRRIIADVHGVPDFLDRATPSNFPRFRPHKRRPVLWAHDDQRSGICKGQDLHGGQERGRVGLPVCRCGLDRLPFRHNLCL